MQAIQDILTAAGINMAGWQFRVSGWRFGGRHGHHRRRQNPNGDIEAWLYHDRSGLITPSLAARSFASLSGIAEAEHSSTPTLLSGYHETAPISAARDDRALSRRLSVSSRSALVGVSVMFEPMPDQVLGAGVGGGIATTSLLADSEADVRRAAGAVFVGYVPRIGPQTMVVASAAHLYGDIRAATSMRVRQPHRTGRPRAGVSASWRGSAMRSRSRLARG